MLNSLNCSHSSPLSCSFPFPTSNLSFPSFGTLMKSYQNTSESHWIPMTKDLHTKGTQKEPTNEIRENLESESPDPLNLKSQVLCRSNSNPDTFRHKNEVNDYVNKD